MRFLAALAFALTATAQSFEHSGFLELSTRLFPRTALGDGSHAVVEALLRVNTSYEAGPWRLQAGMDARSDSHRQAERLPRMRWWDRSLQRPAFTFRNLNASFRAGGFTAQIGKQVIRWGAADVVKPLDRFAPRDFVNLVESEVLPVTGARVSYSFSSGTRRIELISVPRMTPSRLPLARQRWMPLPADVPEYPEINEPEPRYPSDAQFGGLWSHSLGRLEYSACFFKGANYHPVLDFVTISVSPLSIQASRRFPKLRMYGGDIVWSGKPLVVRSEAGYFQSTGEGLTRGDDYLFYVIQAERQVGRWFGLLGYSSQHVVRNARDLIFDPDRSLAGAFLGRTTYQIDLRSDLRFEGAIHQERIAAIARIEYSRSLSEHWRTSFGFTWINGDPSHLLGQFHRNSYGNLTNRFTF